MCKDFILKNIHNFITYIHKNISRITVKYASILNYICILELLYIKTNEIFFLCIFHMYFIVQYMKIYPLMNTFMYRIYTTMTSRFKKNIFKSRKYNVNLAI